MDYINFKCQKSKFSMKNFIDNPIKSQHWDPTKGDYINENVLNEDKLYLKKQQKKKTLITVLAITHILLFLIILMVY